MPDEQLRHLTNPDADWQAEALEQLARAADTFSRVWADEPRKEEGLASNNVSSAAQEVADAVKALGL